MTLQLSRSRRVRTGVVWQVRGLPSGISAEVDIAHSSPVVFWRVWGPGWSTMGSGMSLRAVLAGIRSALDATTVSP